MWVLIPWLKKLWSLFFAMNIGHRASYVIVVLSSVKVKGYCWTQHKEVLVSE